MENLKQCLQKDLDHISKKIEDGYDNNELIAQNLDFILSLAEEQHINLKESDIISHYIANFVDEDDFITKEYIDNYKKYKVFNVGITKVGSKINDEYAFKLVNPRFRSKIELDDSIKIVGDFFKYYDKDIYDYYENFIINGKFFVVKKLFENYGLSAVKDELLDPYIFVKKTNTIRDITVIAHELIHIYINVKQNFSTSEEILNNHVSGFNEVYSHYIEYLMLDYLTSVNYNKRDIINYKKALYSDLIEHLDLLYTLLEPTDIDFNSYNEVLLYNDIRMYSYGLYFLYYFYEQYEEDKEKAKENITNFMIASKDKEFNYLINNYGLDEEKLKDHKVLLRYVKDLY